MIPRSPPPSIASTRMIGTSRGAREAVLTSPWGNASSIVNRFPSS